MMHNMATRKQKAKTWCATADFSHSIVHGLVRKSELALAGAPWIGGPGVTDNNYSWLQRLAESCSERYLSPRRATVQR
jgi:hypothetical protein